MTNTKGLLDEVRNLLRDITAIKSTTENILSRLEAEQPKEDVLAFIRNCGVQHPIRGEIPIEPYPFQEQMLLAFEANDRTIVKKARQMGLTTITALYALFLAATKSNFRVVIMGNRLKSAIEMMHRIRFAAESSRLSLPFVTEMNNTSMAFANGSSILCKAITADALRGMTIDALIIDEMAYVSHKTMEDAWIGWLPCLKNGVKVIVSSTPRFTEGMFYRMWSQAEQCGFVPLAYSWRDHPDRDDEWAKPYRESLGDARFRTEFEADFAECESRPV